MLNLPDAEEDAARARPQSPRHLVRRRPLSGGDRLRGWADVREIHAAAPQHDGACVAKYHVDLNLTAHLDWDEWQRLCAAEPLQTDAPTLCMLSAVGAPSPNPASDAEHDSDDNNNDDEGNGRAENAVASGAPERRNLRTGDRHNSNVPPSAPRAS